MCELSLVIPAYRLAHCLDKTVSALREYFADALPGLAYEIVIVPNRSAKDEDDGSEALALSLQNRFTEVRVTSLVLNANKGKALKFGFAHCRGNYVFLMDGDLPFKLDFIGQALDKLRNGVDFVSANRRMAGAYFRSAAPLLPIIYRRYLMGRWFSRLIRPLFGIHTTDTQAGLKGMTREFASCAFAKQSDSSFFCDIEYFLVCRNQKFSHVELPVEFSLDDEKTTVRVLREMLLCGYWLPRIFLLNLFGHYRRVERYDGVALLDAFNQFPRAEQHKILRQVARSLPENGTLLLREVDPARDWRTRLRQFFTGSAEVAQNIGAWSEELTKLGFKTFKETSSTWFSAHTVLICRKASFRMAPGKPNHQITADDWGLSPAVNDGILDLVQLGIVTRVSVMAQAPHKGYRIGELLQTSAKVGLHFDLTSQYATFFHSKAALLQFLLDPFRDRTLKIRVIREELSRQLTRLQVAGIPVHYFDSHHHVHLLPYVAEAVAPPLRELGIQTVRLPYHRSLWFTKRFNVNLLSWQGRRRLQKAGFDLLPCFYPNVADFRQLERLEKIIDEHVTSEILVHPAKADDFSTNGCRDPYREGRRMEYLALQMIQTL